MILVAGRSLTVRKMKADMLRIRGKHAICDTVRQIETGGHSTCLAESANWFASCAQLSEQLPHKPVSRIYPYKVQLRKRNAGTREPMAV